MFWYKIKLCSTTSYHCINIINIKSSNYNLLMHWPQFCTWCCEHAVFTWKVVCAKLQVRTSHTIDLVIIKSVPVLAQVPYEQWPACPVWNLLLVPVLNKPKPHVIICCASIKLVCNNRLLLKLMIMHLIICWKSSVRLQQ